MAWTSPTQRTTRASSQANVKFANDPIRIEEGEFGDHINNFGQLVQEYDKSGKTTAFKDPKLNPHYISIEGDVSTFCVVKIITPVLDFMNALLAFKEKNVRLSVRSQASGKSSKSYVDHLIMLHRGSNDKRGIPLVIHEEKVHGSILDWETWIEAEYGYHIIGLAGKYTNLRKMVPQLRKYCFENEVVYTLLSDAEKHVGGVWGRCSSWTSGKKSTVINLDKYGPKDHRGGLQHDCKIIIGFTTPEGEQVTARQVLALLCFMALQDHNLL